MFVKLEVSLICSLKVTDISVLEQMWIPMKSLQW